MTSYESTPTRPLQRMAAHSVKELDEWKRHLRSVEASAEVARRMIATWEQNRDEQYAELDRRGELHEPSDSTTSEGSLFPPA